MDSKKITMLSAPLYIDPECHGFCTLIDNKAQMPLLHTHDYYEVFLVTCGTAVHHANNGAFNLKKGSLVFIRPEDSHCYQEPISNDFQLINLLLTKQLMSSLLAFLDFDNQNSSLIQGAYPPQRNINGDRYVSLFSILNRLMIYPKTSTDAYNTAFKLVATEIISLFFFGNADDKNLLYPDWLNTLIEQMHHPENYTVGLSRLYELANCSPEHAGRTFKRYLQQPPTHFLNEIRLDEAARRLIHTDDSIIEIASDVGYNNLSHFYHLFQKRYHTSPKDYRKYIRLSPQTNME